MGRISKSLAVITVLIVVLVIVFLMEPLAQFGTVEAQYPFCNPAIEIDSPQPEEVYNTTSIPIEIVVLPWETGERFVDIYYTIDDGPNIQLNITTYPETTNLYGYGTLDSLTNGNHTIKAFANDTKGNILSCLPSKFLVNTSSNPLPITTSTIPEFPTLVILPLLLSMFSVAVIVRHRKTSNIKQ